MTNTVHLFTEFACCAWALCGVRLPCTGAHHETTIALWDAPSTCTACLALRQAAPPPRVAVYPVEMPAGKWRRRDKKTPCLLRGA